MEIKRIDFYIKWVGVLATAICLIVGTTNSYKEYQSSQRQAKRSDSINRAKEVENRNLEAAKPFIELRQRLYNEALSCAETIIISGDKSSRTYQTAYNRFSELYWGELGLVEDTSVEHNMMKVKKLIDSTRYTTKDREFALLHMSYAMRNSLFNTWKVDSTIVGKLEEH